MRKFENVWAHSSTVLDALRGCTVCSYRLLIEAPQSLHGDVLKPKCRANERPENCLKSKNQGSSSNLIVDFLQASSKASPSILVVGDGNLSFSHSLSKQMPENSVLTASTILSKEALSETYSDAAENIHEIQSASVKSSVLYEVDATSLSKDLGKFDGIIFNFPCVEAEEGQDGQAEELELNQKLIQSFLISAENVLQDDGFVFITHKTKEPFSWWKINEIKGKDLENAMELVFDASHFPEYKARKVSFNDSQMKSFPTFDASIFVFCKKKTKIKSKMIEDLSEAEKLWTNDLLSQKSFVAVTEKRLHQIISLLQLPKPKPRPPKPIIKKPTLKRKQDNSKKKGKKQRK